MFNALVYTIYSIRVHINIMIYDTGVLGCTIITYCRRYDILMCIYILNYFAEGFTSLLCLYHVRQYEGTG